MDWVYAPACSTIQVVRKHAAVGARVLSSCTGISRWGQVRCKEVPSILSVSNIIAVAAPAAALAAAAAAQPAAAATVATAADGHRCGC